MRAGEAPFPRGYRGYLLEANWLEGQGHWVIRVTDRQGNWVDTFLDLADAKVAIDSWTTGVEDGGTVR